MVVYGSDGVKRGFVIVDMLCGYILLYACIYIMYMKRLTELRCFGNNSKPVCKLKYKLARYDQCSLNGHCIVERCLNSNI